MFRVWRLPKGYLKMSDDDTSSVGEGCILPTDDI